MIDGGVFVLFWNTFVMCANAPLASADEIAPEAMRRSVPPFGGMVCDMYECTIVPTVVGMILERKRRGR